METVLTLRIDDDLSARLEAIRIEHHMNVSSYVRAALLAALDRDYPVRHAPYAIDETSRS